MAMTQKQHLIESLLSQGEIKAGVAAAEALQASGGVDETLALVLLSHARSLHRMGYFGQQRRLCEIALAAMPDYFEALHLLGFSAQLHGAFAKAEDYYRRALASKPDYAFAGLALSQMRMMRTGFVEGLDTYEARWDAVSEASGPDWRGLPIPRWRGENLKGKHMYLWAEQGLGDILMFASFLPRLLEQAPKRIALGMFPKLIALFSRSFASLQLEPIDDAAQHALAPTMLTSYPQIEKLAQIAAVPFSLAPLKASYDYASRHGLFDFAAPMGDLLVQSMPDYIPARHQGAYLVADPLRVKQTQSRLAALVAGKRIGISWHTNNTREVTRNIALEQWLALLATPGCHFISLQHQMPRQEIEQFCARHNCRITIDETDISNDADGLAALIASMDEVITIDNSNVHLAGALGIKTTLLLPLGCNFRWPSQPDEGTRWYASVKTLRQQNFGDWQPVIARAAAAIRS